MLHSICKMLQLENSESGWYDKNDILVSFAAIHWMTKLCADIKLKLILCEF